MRPTDTKAVLAVALLWVPVAPVVLAVLARREIARTGEGGQGLAAVGGVAHLTLVVLYLLFVVAYFVVVAFFLVPFASSTGWMT